MSSACSFRLWKNAASIRRGYLSIIPTCIEISAGQEIFIDDGSILLLAEELDRDSIKCRVLVGGELGEKKA